MKKIILLLSVFLSISARVFSQDVRLVEKETPFGFTDTTQKIALINEQVKKIIADSAGYIRLVMEKDNEISRYLFYKNNVIMMAQSIFISEGSELKLEWFFHNKKMIYSEQNWTTIRTRALEQNIKMYLHDDNLFLWISSTKGVIDPASESFIHAAEGLKEYSKELRGSTGK
jgi:hypothetical protein